MTTISRWADRMRPLSVPAIVAIGIVAVSGCTDLKTTLPAPTSGAVTVHDRAWGDSSSAGFHGLFLKAQDWDVAACEPCHGKTFAGGTSGTSCVRCHASFPHPDGWDSTFTGFHQSVAFHGTFLRANGWRLNGCQACHGNSFTGGTAVDVSCVTAGCHVDGSGTAKPPDACNTCHGNFRGLAGDTLSWAPPRAITGGTVSADTGVGAHQIHLLGDTLSKAIRCNECHTVPAAYTDAGHLTATGRAAIAFNGSLGALPTAGGTFVPSPSYDFSTLRCGDTYCHGNWKLLKSGSSRQFEFADTVMSGNNFSPLWTGDSTQVACGSTCHTLPPTGHKSAAISSCGNCHTGVVDNSGHIIDRTKHMNGKVNVFGTERNF